jgi:hypothetical protein
MSEKTGADPQEQRHHQDSYAGPLSTQQMRTVGQRRRDAEEKLAHHLEEARHKDDPHGGRAVEKAGGQPERGE